MKAKEKISMKELLKRFDDCDSFSLSGWQVNAITDEELENLRREINKSVKERFLKLYSNEKSSFDFDLVYDIIEKNVFEYVDSKSDNAIHKSIYLDLLSEGMNSSLKSDEECSNIVKELQNLGEPTDQQIRAITLKSLGICKDYDILKKFIIDVCDYIKDKYEYIKTFNDNKTKVIETKLDDELKNNIIKVVTSFNDGAVTYSLLSVVYYFKLNDETKSWLSKSKNEFELNTDLEDLVFYKNNEAVFTSITHEKMNSLGEDFYDDYFEL